ncbi:MAG: rod shape-determining protein MreC [Brumimicrobium sp.]
MRKFLEFLERFQVFLVFLILQIIALTSYFSVMNFSRTVFFNTSQTVVGTLLSWERDLIKFVYLDDANRNLQIENVKLTRKIPENFIPIDDRTAIINDTLNEIAFEYIPATVINSSYHHPNNFFTINAGTKKGIKKRMGVISPNGVVGIVFDVSKHYAIVKSILTEDFNLTAYIGGTGTFGILKYDAKNPRMVQLTGISNDIRIHKSSIVKTRGSGGYFPQGLEIGIIDSFEPLEGKPMWNINVLLSQDMRKLRYVYVIKNINWLELNELQKSVESLNE